MKDVDSSPSKFSRSPPSSLAVGFESTTCVVDSGTKGTTSPRGFKSSISSPQSACGSVVDDANSAYGALSAHGSTTGHDDVTAVMGNVYPHETLHTLKSEDEITVGTISSFVTTDGDKEMDIEARQPLADIAEIRHDIRDQLDELDHTVATLTGTVRSGLSEASSMYSGGSDVEEFYVSEAGNNSSSRHNRNVRGYQPETVEEEVEHEDEVGSGVQSDSNQLNVAPQVLNDGSRATGSECKASDRSQTSNERHSLESSQSMNNSGSINSESISPGDKNSQQQEKKITLEKNLETSLEYDLMKNSGSSSGIESRSSDSVQQVQPWQLGTPEKSEAQTINLPVDRTIETPVDHSIVHDPEDPPTIQVPFTPKSEQTIFLSKAYIPVLDHENPIEEDDGVVAKSTSKRRWCLTAFFCLGIVGLILIIYFSSGNFETAESRNNISSPVKPTFAPTPTPTPTPPASSPSLETAQGLGGEIDALPTISPEHDSSPRDDPATGSSVVVELTVAPVPAPNHSPIKTPSSTPSIGTTETPTLNNEPHTSSPIMAVPSEEYTLKPQGDMSVLVPGSTTVPSAVEDPSGGAAEFPAQNTEPSWSSPPQEIVTYPTPPPSLMVFQPLPSLPPTGAPTISMALTESPALASPTQVTNPVAGRFRLWEISGDLLDDPAAAQYKAHQWLLNEDPANLDLASLSLKTLEQRYIAAVLYFSTNGDFWSSTLNFMTERDVCEWHDIMSGNGVLCDTEGTIEQIIINQNLLEGPLPVEFHELTGLKRLQFRSNRINGSVPSEFGNLSRLEELDLRQNRLTGSFPESIFELANLKMLLMLQNTEIGGTIPESLGNATNLEMVSFQRCGMSGSIPTRIGMLSNLYFFTLLGNEMTGVIPEELTQLPRLEVLELAENTFSGSIPGFAGQTELYFISLSKNQLSGTLPETIGALPGLLFFDIRTNRLSGAIPESFNSVPELVTFHASDNNLTGSIPHFSGNTGLLQSVQLAGNNLSGNLGGLFADGGPIGELHYVDLSSNFLTGSIPTNIGQFKKLANLALSDNGLAGSIPLEIGGLEQLDTLRLFNNKLTGTVPEEVGLLSTLKYLDLSANEFEGQITDTLALLLNLSQLNLSNNNFYGTLPESFDVFNSLDELYLQNNSLTGNFDSILCETDDEIRTLVADCGEPNPRVTCTCCTSCCNEATGCM